MKPTLSSRLFLLAAVPVLAAGAPSDRMTRVENRLRPDVTIEGDTPWTLEERMQHYEVPAVSIAVIQDFKVVDYRVYGVADRETGEKATGDTLFQAGSVSKPVTAFGALKMRPPRSRRFWRSCCSSPTAGARTRPTSQRSSWWGRARSRS